MALEDLSKVDVSFESVRDRLKSEDVGMETVEKFVESFVEPTVQRKARKEIWVDSLPDDKAAIGDSRFTVWVGTKGNSNFTGGEFAWLMDPVPMTYQVDDKVEIKGLKEMFRKVRAPILHLKGLPVCYGCSPGAFHSRNAWQEFQQLRRKTVKLTP